MVVASQLRGHSGNSYIDEFGGEDLHDILVLKDILKEIKGCNAKNISMIGGSRGGMMTLLSLTKLDDLRSVIIEAAPTDIENSYKLRPQLKEFRRDMYDVDSIDENRKRSAIYFASKISKNTPILILHGRQDKSVDIIDTYKLAIELQINNIPHEIHTFIDADHMLKVPQKWDFKENWLKKYSK
ncbi:MAG: prolyl oligopeptidase family serine peptidase [Thermales bacterium]|nr:prolyl oligopeptidase family serine peptidase [Thermales bacterium]